ncbi:exodeoxyribonuclease VII large subunit [Haloglycomyces albus]|uniref:exodeoxyribonuclease VII large subunit n=1 Tax=Haloglycomyces albus TaxID=526067 RepID=UPI00046CCC6F|nr:exodeoxyribonuclease VII large subunit [Haloglycomyces albus]
MDDTKNSAAAKKPTRDEPWTVAHVSDLIGQWIGRLGDVWIEGQITQINRRSGARMAFLNLRDPSQEVSLQVTTFAGVLDKVDPPLQEGSQVVMHAKPSWYKGRGTLSMRAAEIHQVGLGELLARLEKLKKQLASEGLFAPEKKQPLPFLPRTIGLITGRNSDAERDVLRNATARLPSAHFEVREVAVQGVNAVTAVTEALHELDAMEDVDVIVIARGGGSVEDLLPFSDEHLCRTVYAAHTPVVSAIGHEPDTPLLDYVADLRASTPTAAGKTIVPDLVEEQQRLDITRTRLRQALKGFLDQQDSALESMRARPVLARPDSMITVREDDLRQLRARLRTHMKVQFDKADDHLEHTRARLRGLSPQSTLDRGYAIALNTHDGTVVRDSNDAADDIEVRLAHGRLTAHVTERINEEEKETHHDEQ